MTNAKQPSQPKPRKRAPAQTKNVRDQHGNLLPSTEPEMAAAGLTGVRLYSRTTAKKLRIELEPYPSACSFAHGTWHVYYKAK